ncbi:histidine-containing phosphotransfer protein 3 isoform X1 [Vitis vinifera]|nr:histidine-containing phosphotransfer protein 3 isoform X1 [Vitis vinifera]XP_059593630.1 histidine-containing phosphotransfer protein 3 isoform X1 [Vitis vinifera]XP_059593631.1 histidine-containing phosphotransfer protein 3 isoform X1 [Vitis vinifera]|eukprot:XP_019075879.1 PREDICTED: histidine-containing phosphotransfer protein 3 isoform X2 [Vitis vinifera]
MNCYGCTSIPEAMADERDGFPGLHFHPQPIADQGIVNDQFCQIQALKSEEQPDAVVRLIDTYILDVERILSNLKSYIDLPDVDFSKLAVEIYKIEEKSLQIGAEHMKIACANLILACDQKHKDNFCQYLAWMMNEFTKTQSKLEAFAQMERKIIRVRSKVQK